MIHQKFLCKTTHTNWLLRNLPCYKKPRGNVLCPCPKCLGGTKHSKWEERISMTNMLDVYQILKPQTIQLKCKYFRFLRWASEWLWRKSIVYQTVMDELRKQSPWQICSSNWPGSWQNAASQRLPNHHTQTQSVTAWLFSIPPVKIQLKKFTVLEI